MNKLTVYNLECNECNGMAEVVIVWPDISADGSPWAMCEACCDDLGISFELKSGSGCFKVWRAEQ